jgi:hypothetical protein
MQLDLLDDFIIPYPFTASLNLSKSDFISSFGQLLFERLTSAVLALGSITTLTISLLEVILFVTD